MSEPQTPSAVDLTESKSAEIIGVVTVLWVMALFNVVLRLWARKIAKLSLWWDDWLVLFALIPFSATCIANYVSVRFGDGKHLLVVVEQNPVNVKYFLQYIYTVEILYPFIIGPVKCSICCFYIRIFGRNKNFRFVCFSLITITALWAISLLLGSILQCKRVSDAWNPTADRNNCVNLRGFLVGTNVPNIVIDFLILITPIAPISQLNLPAKKRILVILILMLGAGEIAFSSVRLGKLVSLDTTDATWNYFDAIVWSTVEQSMGIICVCLPAMGPLLPRKATGYVNDSTDRKTRGSAPHTDDSFTLKPAKQRQSDKLLDSMDEYNSRQGTIHRTIEVHVDYDDSYNPSELSHNQQLGLAK